MINQDETNKNTKQIQNNKINSIKDFIKSKKKQFNNQLINNHQFNLNAYGLTQSQDTLKLFCQICKYPKTQNNNYFIADCIHKNSFCNFCLQAYSICTIQQSIKLVCPSNQCTREIDFEGQFFKSIPSTLQLKCKKNHDFYSAYSNLQYIKCSNKDCEGYISLQNNLNQLTCKICNNKLCLNCYLPSHEGSCEEYQSNFIDKILNNRWCIRCSQPTDHYQLSNRIVCNCSFQFCKICGAQWTSAHFVSHKSFSDLALSRENPQQLNGAGTQREISPTKQVQNQQNKQNKQKSCSQKCCFYITFPFRLIAVIIIMALLSVVFFGIIILLMCEICRQSKRRHRDKAGRKCQNEMCQSYFQLCPKVYQTFLTF